MPETMVRRSWDSLGEHGYVYLDSFGDTGATQVPRLPRLHGSTGTFGDPRWETLDREDTFCLFAVATRVGLMWSVLEREAVAWSDHVLVLPPPRHRLRRPELQSAVVASQVAFEDVLTELRAQAGLPVGDLAAMLGVSRRQFYNWVGRENDPDLENEQRVRRTAELVDQLHDHYGDSRRVRAALLASTPHGSPFDAFKASDLAVAEQAIQAAMAGGALRETPAPSQQLAYDRERVLVELEHLRDAPLRGDG